MQPIIFRIGKAITSLGAVIAVLLLTIVAGTCFSHTVFYESLPDNMQNWEKTVASWAIACSWECCLMVVVSNAHLLANKHIPILLSVCCGIVVLFFIHAFDVDLSAEEYLRRWFIGLLFASVNITFSSLFYRKWCESNQQKSQLQLITELTTNLSERDSELKSTKAKINELDSRLLEASDYIIELEAFKKAEISKLTCPHCGVRQESVYKLAAHRNTCGRGPKQETTMSVNRTPEQVS